MNRVEKDFVDACRILSLSEEEHGTDSQGLCRAAMHLTTVTRHLKLIAKQRGIDLEKVKLFLRILFTFITRTGILPYLHFFRSHRPRLPSRTASSRQSPSIMKSGRMLYCDLVTKRKAPGPHWNNAKRSTSSCVGSRLNPIQALNKTSFVVSAMNGEKSDRMQKTLMANANIREVDFQNPDVEALLAHQSSSFQPSRPSVPARLRSLMNMEKASTPFSLQHLFMMYRPYRHLFFQPQTQVARIKHLEQN